MQFGVIVIDWEHNANSCVSKTIKWIFGEMNCVHFEICILSIDGMLRWGMEMELSSVVFFTSTIDLLGNVGCEHHWSRYLPSEINLYGVPVKFGLSHKWILVNLSKFISWTFIHFVVISFTSLKILITFAQKINWGLVFTCAAKVYSTFGDLNLRPVIAKIIIIECYSRSIYNSDGS